MFAALASIVGFTLLFGWELYIGSSMFRTVMPDHSRGTESLLYFSLAVIAAIYCMLGGLRGNLYANKVQNYLAGGALLVAIFWLWWFMPGTQPFTLNDFVDVSTLSALTAELTVAGIITNVVLFAVYQFVDMSVWQNIAAVSDDGNKPRRSLIWSAVWILFFPGVTGSALGMLMRSHASGITADNIVPSIVIQVSTVPWLFFLLVMGFFAMMLSTVDGLLLAACQAVTWDVTDRKAVLQILTARGSPEFDPTDITDAPALARKIVEREDSISDYLYTHLAEERRTELAEYRARDPKQLSETLAAALNEILAFADLYSAERFEGVVVPPQAKELIEIEPAGSQLALLNRWLLEAAYPDELAYNQFSNTLRREGVYADPKWNLQGPELERVEDRALDHARVAILLVAVIGGAATLFLLRAFEQVNPFNLLYITYVAQMALFPAIWVILHGERRLQPRGAASIGLGLLAGFVAVWYGLYINAAFAPWAPTVAVAVACVIYWPFRRFPEQPQSTEVSS